MSTRRRVLIHVQHLLGTGHLVRAAQLARAFASAGHETLLASGGDPVPGLPLAGVRLIQLPPVRALDARFSDLGDGHGRPYAQLLPERRARLLELAARFRPDALIVEGYPFGRRAFRHEIDPLIEAVRGNGAHLVAASVRDVLVTKPNPRRNAEIEDKVTALFDMVLVHGDPGFLPLEASFPVQRIAPWLRYTGYVADPPPPTAGTRVGVLVSAGGGAVGAPLLRTALAARPLSRVADASWRLLAGPNLAGEVARELAAAAPAGVVVEANRADFVALMARSAVSVSQAGYNTVLDVLRTRTPAVLVPFEAGGETEQALRADYLARAGLAQIVGETALTPSALAQAIDQAMDRAVDTAAPGGKAIAMNGAANTVRIVVEALKRG